MRRLTCAVWGFALVLFGCSEVAGIEEIACEPGCQDETTRVFCDAAGKRQVEACPVSTEECAAPACEAGACTFKPAVGAPCGETGGAQCNEGFACLGGNFHLSAIRQQTCLATDDGKVWCWGDNMYGQLGDGTTRTGSESCLGPWPARSCGPGERWIRAHLRAAPKRPDLLLGQQLRRTMRYRAVPGDRSRAGARRCPGREVHERCGGSGAHVRDRRGQDRLLLGKHGHGQCGIDPEVAGLLRRSDQGAGPGQRGIDRHGQKSHVRRPAEATRNVVLG